MLRQSLFFSLGLLCAGAGLAADRAIVLNPVNTASWEFATHTPTPRARPGLAVGFWQRASGAKPGVGANYVSTMEYRLPEAAAQRVRSASFQFSGHQAQCVGAEPVVIEVYAYAADGRAELTDTSAGTRIARLSADCGSNPAFATPIDVTALVRQLSVPAGVRHLGFNIRKANNRQGPGLFSLAAGRLTVVLAEHAVAPAAGPAGPQPAVAAAAVDTGSGPGMQDRRDGLKRAIGTLVLGAGSKTAREQARAEANEAVGTAPPSRDGGGVSRP